MAEARYGCTSVFEYSTVQYMPEKNCLLATIIMLFNVFFANGIDIKSDRFSIDRSIENDVSE